MYRRVLQQASTHPQDPLFQLYPSMKLGVRELVYDKLAAPSPYLANARPWLATAIVTEGQDGRVWRIELRDGVRWHDGKPFTASDVVFTLRYYRDGTPNRWTHHVSDTPKLTTIEPIDRLSLRIGCERPCPMFDRVTAADLVILPEHLWRSVKEPHLYHGPLIGAGPYRVSQLEAGRFLRLEANRDYFGGVPRVASIFISFIRNPATAFAALSAGELDFGCSAGTARAGRHRLAASRSRGHGRRSPICRSEDLQRADVGRTVARFEEGLSARALGRDAAARGNRDGALPQAARAVGGRGDIGTG